MMLRIIEIKLCGKHIYTQYVISSQLKRINTCACLGMCLILAENLLTFNAVYSIKSIPK